ncbi:hypothetical protein D3C86_1387560 [compost metagenome]
MALAGDDDAGLDAGLFFGDPDALGNAGEIGVCTEPDAVTMVGRDDQFTIDRVGLGKFSQIGFRQNRVVFVRLEHLRHRIVALDKFGEIRPDILAIAQKAAGVYAVFLRLSCDKRGRCRPFKMAVDFRFQQMGCQMKLLPCEPASMPRWWAMLSPISA